MKHKHGEVIKAWADGAKIEYKSYGEWSEATTPYFSEVTEYRVMKVKDKVKIEGWLNVYSDGFSTGLYKTKEDAEKINKNIPHKTIFISEEIEVEE